jgi:endogenous inhibitor of DNA gyrase (YacG/DUF329 family)
MSEAPAGGGESRPCPVCGRPSLAEHHPFCSARCRDVDLGRWLDGRYVIPGRRPGFDDDEDG